MDDHSVQINYKRFAILLVLLLLFGPFPGTPQAASRDTLQVSPGSGGNLPGGNEGAQPSGLSGSVLAGWRPLKTGTSGGDPNLLSPEAIRKIRNGLVVQGSSLGPSRKTVAVTKGQRKNLDRLLAGGADGKSFQVRFNMRNGTPSFIKSPKRMVRGLTRSRNGLARARSAAKSFLVSNRDLLKLSDPGEELVSKREWADSSGAKHFHYQQTYRGVVLWGKEIMVHLDGDDSVYLLQGRYEPTPELLETTPEITEEQALEAVRQHLGMTGDGGEPRIELIIYNTEDGGSVLAYKVDISPAIDQRWLYFIEAANGEVLHRINNIHSEVVSASSPDLNATVRSFNAWLEESTYYLLDPTSPLDDPPYSPIPELKPLGNTYILDIHNSEDTDNFTFITSPSVDSNWDPAGVSGAYNTRTVYDYYKNTFGRNGIDDENMNYLIVVHYGSNYANAFWNGQLLAFGDGDNRTFSSLVASLDITAHEIQHGITEFTAGLIYANQSGALNEAFSDIFAVMVDRDDWTVGEDVTLAAPGYLRSLVNPALGLSSLPTKMSEYRNLPNTTQGDYGGVHINMSIPSRAAYLIAEGLSVEGLGESIGRDKTEQIFYRALTTYLHASSQFLDARRATIQSAEDLYGAESTEVGAVQTGWDVVEVIEGSIGAPDDQKPTPTDPVSGQDMMVYLYPFDGSHDRPFSSEELYQLYAQTFSDPFTGYDPNQDMGPLNNLAWAFYTRPAAYTGTGGTVIFYVGTDSNLYRVFSDGSMEEQLTTTGGVWSFAVSPDGRNIAYTSIYDNDNNIYVVDLETETVTPYPLESPTDLPPGSEGINSILYADSLAFDYTGRTIVFDALNCLSTPDNPCSGEGGGLRYWSVGFLNVSDGSLVVPFPAQNSNINIGFPSFAYNNSFVVALDVITANEDDGSTTFSSMVGTLDMNSSTNEIIPVASPNFGFENRALFGVPSFWGDDDYITMQFFTDTNGSAIRVPIDSGWAGDVSAAEQLNDYAVAMPLMHRAVARTITGKIDPSTSTMDFENVNLGQTSILDLTLSNSGNRDVRITGIEISGSSAFSHNGTNALLPQGESMTIQVTFAPTQSSGTQAATLSITSDADNPTTVVSLTGTTACSVPAPDNGYLITCDLWVRAVINSEEKGPIEAFWRKGGEDTTSAGDQVIWGHFYAGPNDVSWGSENNPDLFVKIWFDHSGRLDVNYFHVSVPDIVVYSDYTYDGTVDQQGTTTMSRRYIRQYYQDGQSFSEENTEDGIPAEMFLPTGNPSGYLTINGLKIGAVINTVERGPIDAVMLFGGQDTTSRGDQVVWGHFYASPNDVSWGSPSNPDVFVKIWFDVSGRVDVNFFHVSVPDIEVYSDLPDDGSYDQKGTTTTADRYIMFQY